MIIACPKCNSRDVDCLYEIVRDPVDTYYSINSKCNVCQHIGQNVTFWHDNGRGEINSRLGEVDQAERQVWEKKNV